MSPNKRFAIVGTGGRCRMFIDAIGGEYADHNEVVGLCDISPTRMNVWAEHIAERHGRPGVPTYHADDFDRMIEETRPDAVIVTTVDAYHHQYIIRAMELGCDAISEKPMTTSVDKARAIFEAIERTGRTLRVTFNYRYQPVFTKLREVVASGAIGTPTLVDFQWRLDTSHGADYFRRWHREKDKSGGLLVHKATHHFDLVNFILGDYPRHVFAHGALRFYGQANAEARGQQFSYDRYRDKPADARDPFALDITANGRMKRLYADAEADSGYVRDRNVFAGEDKWPITAEDTLAVNARYRNGALLSYSLVAYCPWEGERLTVTGTEGQVDYFGRGRGHIIAGQSDEELAADQYQGEKYIRLQRMFEQPEELAIPEARGGHGGGDWWICNQLFSPEPADDPHDRAATHIDGAASILLGLAANQSIETGQAVNVDDLMKID